MPVQALSRKKTADTMAKEVDTTAAMMVNLVVAVVAAAIHKITINAPLGFEVEGNVVPHAKESEQERKTEKSLRELEGEEFATSTAAHTGAGSFILRCSACAYEDVGRGFEREKKETHEGHEDPEREGEEVDEKAVSVHRCRNSARKRTRRKVSQ